MNEEKRELTFGEKAVGLTFNPANHGGVQLLKEEAAVFIDSCNNGRDASDDPEKKRMYSLAITAAQEAQMWAVKAITWGL